MEAQQLQHAMLTVLANYQQSLIKGYTQSIQRLTQFFGEQWVQAMHCPGGLAYLPVALTERQIQYFKALALLKKPEWTTPNRVVLSTPLVQLRDFSPAPDNHSIKPVFILPFQSGQHSASADFAPGRSQVEVFIKAGFSRVFAVEWLNATQDTKHASIEDYLTAVHDCIQQIGGPVNLIGDCQGGWLAAIYAALYPEDIHTLALVGAPIDLDQGDGDIHNYAYVLSNLLGTEAYEAIVASSNGVMSKDNIMSGFLMMRPDMLIKFLVELYIHADDPDFVECSRDYLSWWVMGQDLPGDYYLWMVQELFVDNKLPKAKLQIGGRTVDLHNIICPLYLFGGERDFITPKQQVFATANLVSTPPDQVMQLTYAGGHIGLFTSPQTMEDQWRQISQDMMRRSQ